MASRVQVLVVNDDGFGAPGLLAITGALAAAGVDVYVAGPHTERSATGHGITIYAPLVATPVLVPGAREAFAVSGLPADCTMLALGPLFAHVGGRFDAVVSGINRGNNAGLHVIYSGTVAGAREAAAKGVPAVALSLDTHLPDADYSAAAAVSVPLLLRYIARLRRGEASSLRGAVLNVNVPSAPLSALRGYQLTRQGYGCTMPSFCEVPVPEGALQPQPGAPGAVRAWQNRAGAAARLDHSAGSDTGAMAAGHVAITVVTLLSHAPPLAQQALAAAPLSPPVPQPAGFSDAAADAVLDAAVAAASATQVGAAQLAPAEDSAL